MRHSLSHHIESEESRLAPVINDLKIGRAVTLPSVERARGHFVRLWNIGIRNIEQDGAVLRPAV